MDIWDTNDMGMEKFSFRGFSGFSSTLKAPSYVPHSFLPWGFPTEYYVTFLISHEPYKSRDSSVGIALSYGLDERGSKVRFPVGAGNFSLHHRVQNGSGALPASYIVGTRVSFPGSKAAGGCSWPLAPI
jgi:hypothetical protein